MSTYIVTGATGHQGGAVVKYLLAAGVKVHAVVRDQTSPKAKALQDKGVVLFRGTHEEPETVFRAAAAGCTGVFLNPTVFEPGKAKEQAERIINACKAGAGETLTTIVLSSTSRVDEMSTNLALPSSVHPWLGQYYTAKAEVETAVRESQIPNFTILRPPVLAYDFLMPNSALSHGYPALPRLGTYVTSLDDSKTMPYLDEADVGKFAVAALLDPAKFSGHAFDMASDNLTAREVTDILTRVSGIDIKFHKRTSAELEETANTEFFQVFEKLTNKSPRHVNVEALEAKYGIKLTRFEDYLQANKDKLMDSLPPRSLPAVAALDGH
ncbi:uncharacterized protein A1O9_08085 [Exophiala aquamarina CBS 119918]|uniref:NmrA-like domain-containing protein n=1 Tax=Exophiala aquamarina CBS 119918 TaxID=1182545 RepID=A0A072PIL0_9EURO|nr:uncharacterized protein A1O9_08085 [Exophiala aquamarina CBS 119918]KEF55335.1 hypothetical protein A1O9_08085 [Exophiala aquamarina CBS 119918]